LVRALADRYSGNAADAEDILQEVFWRVWRGAEGWMADRAKVSTWIYRIAMNCCIDWGRRESRRPKSTAQLETEIPDDVVVADQVVADRAVLNAVKSEIALLPERQRFALLLAVSNDSSTREIAEVMEITEGAAEQLLVRARKRLRGAVRRADDGG